MELSLFDGKPLSKRDVILLTMYSVIIIGGGIAGCSTALSLIRSNPEASFLLIDDADPTCFKVRHS